MRLSLRISGFKVRGRSRGFSSIVGGIFMVLMAFVIASSYFLWTLSQNTIYFAAVRDKNQFEADRLSENMQVNTTSYAVNTNGSVTVLATLQNTGASSIQLKTVWVYVSNSTWTNYNFSALSNTNVQGGTFFSLSAVLSVSGVNATGSYNFASWLMTARGNVVTLQQMTLTNNIVVSQTTQGIGALMMDFQNFTYYNVTGSGPYSLNFSAGASGYYVQGATASKAQIAFRVIVTNLDQNQRSITLTGGSVLFSIFPSGQQSIRGAFWYIVNVNSTTGAISNTYTNVTLIYNQATLLYFASNAPGIFGPSGVAPNAQGTTPVNLALIGQIGSDAFGQNIPFVSIDVAS